MCSPLCSRWRALLRSSGVRIAPLPESNFLSCGGLHLQPMRASRTVVSAIPAGNAGGSRSFSFSFESAAGCTRGSQRQQARRSAVLSFLFFRFEFSCAFAVGRLDWLAPFSCAPRPPVGRRPSRIFDAHGWIFLQYIRLSSRR